MSQAKSPQSKENILNELNELLAFKAVADTPDGQAVLNFIMTAACLSKNPFDNSKNSGETAIILGKQAVGRVVFDKLIEAGVDVGSSIFSNKQKDKIEDLRSKYNNLINKK